MLEMRIDTLSPIRVAAVRHVGPFQELKGAFEKVCGWAGANNLFGPGTKVLGVFHDDPKSTEAAQLRSDAAVTVDDSVEADPDSGITITEIPGGTYAVGILKGPYEGLEAAYTWIYQEWLPEAGHRPLPQASYEVYLNDESTVPKAELLTAIHIPIEVV